MGNRTPAYLVEPLESRRLLSVLPVADLNTSDFVAPSTFFGSSKAVVDGTLFFLVGSGNSASPTNQLWKSDGTATGTSLVTTLLGPGYCLTAYGGELYFVLNFVNNYQLWISDGTADGTHQDASLTTSIAPALIVNNGFLF